MRKERNAAGSTGHASQVDLAVAAAGVNVPVLLSVLWRWVKNAMKQERG